MQSGMPFLLLRRHGSYMWICEWLHHVLKIFGEKKKDLIWLLNEVRQQQWYWGHCVVKFLAIWRERSVGISWNAGVYQLIWIKKNCHANYDIVCLFVRFHMVWWILMHTCGFGYISISSIINEMIIIISLCVCWVCVLLPHPESAMKGWKMNVPFLMEDPLLEKTFGIIHQGFHSSLLRSLLPK